MNKSLVSVAERDGRVRYGRLETIRQYAREKLLDSGEGDQVRARHAKYFLRFAADGDRQLRGAQSLQWVRLMDLEYQNLRAALDYSLGGSQESTVGPQLAIALAEFWDRRSYFAEAHLWLKSALDRDRSLLKDPIGAKLLYRYAIINSIILGRWDEFRPLLEECLEIFQAAGDDYRVDAAYARMWLGFILHDGAEPDPGYSHLREAIRIFTDRGETWGLGFALNFLSSLKFDDGDVEAACALAQEGATQFAASGDQYGVAINLDNLGRYKVRRGDYVEGRVHLQEALGIFIEFENKGFAFQTLASLGDAARGLNEYEKAENLYRRCLSLCQEAGMHTGWLVGCNLALGYTVLGQGKLDQARAFFVAAGQSAEALRRERNTIRCLAGLAALQAVQGDPELAVRLFGTLETQIQAWLDGNRSIYDLFQPIDDVEIERYRALCRINLTQAVFETCWAEGRKLTLDEAFKVGMAKALSGLEG